MDMDLLYTVQRLAEARAATTPPPHRAPRISLRERTAQALAATEAQIHAAAHLRSLYADTSLAELRALARRRRERSRRLTPREAEDACWALLDAGWDPAADRPESDSEEDDDEAVEELAARLNARSRALWARHVREEDAPLRYVEGWPTGLVGGAPTVLEDEYGEEGGG
ncbi:hypothetical protein ISF_01853 [Cordyceps fumosorosea ARSEF 2679]|uniref:Uncharacterized protein n=1 Tax=Cordyceps fumosorosea (strain ARSEF 2679) TaxID=1081104 RepID=A0A162JN23_CORFA|nr:hypothetical protein ISF_01853 [Cordyceps fumosorosea ARSEF 2679]OAA71302.1 hypothetical protein ISF_01853 [Cordyceps fumosorosea ARSEF 2679]